MKSCLAISPSKRRLRSHALPGEAHELPSPSLWLISRTSARISLISLARIAMISMTRSIWAAIVASVGPSVTCGPAGNGGDAGGGAFFAGNGAGLAKSSFQSREKYIRTRKQILK